MLTWQSNLTNHHDVKRSCHRRSTYAQRIVTPPKGWEGGRKIELKQRLLEPKWHWSVRYCCNFLCAKHGYRQITRHPISILLLSSVTAQVNLSHFTSLTLVAKRTQNEYLEAKAPPMSSFAVVPMSVRERLTHNIVNICST